MYSASQNFVSASGRNSFVWRIYRVYQISQISIYYTRIRNLVANPQNSVDMYAPQVLPKQEEEEWVQHI